MLLTNALSPHTTQLLLTLIAIPAGILQPPLYHPDYPESLNYGGIGVVIGHEVTHGFDDKGRQFDPHGNLKQWWNPSSLRNFHNKSNCMENQYNKYFVDEIQMKVMNHPAAADGSIILHSA